MKTFARLIRRYVLAAVGISLLLVILAVIAFIWVSIRYGLRWQEQFGYPYSQIADHLQRDASGNFSFDEEGAAHWLAGYEWAMVLDDDGQVAWQYQLPPELNHPYTASEIAAFSRWYLADYPVFCQVRDYGLLVLALPQGSTWKYSFWTYPELVEGILYGGSTVLLVVLGLILAFCFLFSWRGTRSLQAVANGLDTLAEGRTVELSTRGFTGELAEKLNQTSAQLQYRNEIIQRRDMARTNWIAGVSHDIRTPLSLILGWAEQLQQDERLPAQTRRKAEGIQEESEKIKALIEDLNLTSKLQYGAQPLRRISQHAGPLLRKLVADFCNSTRAGNSTVEFQLEENVEKITVMVDEGLLHRVIENILGNSIRHNEKQVHCSVKAAVQGRWLEVTLTDDGKGYPAEILSALQNVEPSEHTPHILGLHVVEQIIQAHGGDVTFTQNKPHGAKTILRLPVEK